MEEAGELLEETLDEEKAADEKLSGLAEDINPEVEKDESEEEDDGERRKPKKATARS
jgi:ferritin-like metal-binding protein YciE